jgi:hypothetical protein
MTDGEALMTACLKRLEQDENPVSAVLFPAMPTGDGKEEDVRVCYEDDAFVTGARRCPRS